MSQYIPKITGDWKLLFKPERNGNYVNDHSIILANDGKWHLYGITSLQCSPSNERYFVHGVSDTLISDTGMTEAGRIIDHGVRAWAPCVVNHEDKYYIYYGPSPTRLNVSIDMYEWMGYPINLYGEPVLAAHRDHMVIKINDYTWVMYVSGVRNGYGCISCFVSNNLTDWRFVQYALTSSDEAPLKPAWGAFESPYVVKYKDLYYLFTTYTDCNDRNYQNTLVFCSSNPYDFGNYTGTNHNEMCVAELSSHAGEVIYDADTESYYITSCGWPNKGIPVEGGVAIAKLEWFEKE